MAEEQNDLSANTMAFRAFVERGEAAEPSRPSRVGLIAGVVAIVVIAAALIVWFAVS